MDDKERFDKINQCKNLLEIANLLGYDSIKVECKMYGTEKEYALYDTTGHLVKIPTTRFKNPMHITIYNSQKNKIKKKNRNDYNKDMISFVMAKDNTIYEKQILVENARPDVKYSGTNFNIRITTFSNYCDFKISKMNNLEHEKIVYYLNDGETVFTQTYDERLNELKKVNPYAADYAKEHKYEPIDLIMMPELELLDKAGYAFAEEILTNSMRTEKDILCLYRLVKHGKNPKACFKTDKIVYDMLKDEKNLEKWDEIRKMNKMVNVSKDMLFVLYNDRELFRNMNKIRKVLKEEYDGKPIFKNLESLIEYLRRIDMYEAISVEEGIMLLTDYFSSCRMLEMRPRIDGDSLKREHDVAARNVRNIRDVITSKKMIGVYEKNKKWDYTDEDGELFIRTIKDFEDLCDEANQQHNCVACYADKICNGHSIIMVLREKANPDKSYVTVEISQKGHIRQAYKAYNGLIYDKRVTDFFEKWKKDKKVTEAA